MTLRKSPTLLTSTSSFPQRPLISLMSAVTAAAERTSVSDTQLAGMPASAARAAWARAGSISAMTTRAPRAAKASAMARPMPAPPPVTSAVLPVSVRGGGLSFISRIRRAEGSRYSNEGPHPTRALGESDDTGGDRPLRPAQLVRRRLCACERAGAHGRKTRRRPRQPHRPRGDGRERTELSLRALPGAAGLSLVRAAHGAGSARRRHRAHPTLQRHRHRAAAAGGAARQADRNPRRDVARAREHRPRGGLAEGGVRRLGCPLGGPQHALLRADRRVPAPVEPGARGLPRRDRGLRQDLFLPAPGAGA